MKIVTVVIPTYNEEENIPLIYQRIKLLFQEKLPEYQFEILYIDNYSQDHSRDVIRLLAAQDSRVKAIFNARNFGFTRSTFYGLTQATGDCAVLIFADMQDSPEVIEEFVHQWAAGFKIVVGVKQRSKENPIMFLIRKCYYAVIRKISEIDHIEQYNGFGLYDRAFLQVLRKLDDPLPYLRGMVAEFGFQRKEVFYLQDIRKHGASKFSFFKLYDVAMQGITSYSKIVMRLATLLGFGLGFVSIVVAIVTVILKLLNWSSYPLGNAAIATGVFFLGGVQLFFIGLLGEYILGINTRVMRRPLVIEDERVNFDAASDSSSKTIAVEISVEKKVRP